MDDGTGAIRCNWWRQTDCHDNMHEHEPSIRHGNLVTVFGTIAMYKDKREITIDLISMWDNVRLHMYVMNTVRGACPSVIMNTGCDVVCWL